ncbi:SAP domain-containing ribonucleoprotein [Smittium mucronatum]|uniref:SAP domain-containing ribonucleoprotein n=1 Tax=Smittium mucronatum TaxID=133383 RepID=A0A1R0H7D6_9FUNG|nr:SAP domain-containing ribonucleoprotein [Smittium mucronatum]OLY85004.1 SAP domain-containing ribonucleoprotein [Smittium mucronatum]
MQYDEKTLKKCKVQELKSILKDLGLNTEGKKDELISRILEQSKTIEPVKSPKPVSESTKNIIESGAKNELTPISAKDANEVKNDPASIKELSESEKLLRRAEKFGLATADISDLTEEERLQRRILKFGPIKTPSQKPSKIEIDTSSNSLDPEILKKRAERFGITQAVSPSGLEKKTSLKREVEISEEEKEKINKRQERFGSIDGAQGPISKTKPSEAVSAEEREKMRKRAERFGLPIHQN